MSAAVQHGQGFADMARAHQYILDYRVFRAHLSELVARFSEEERDKAAFVLGFASEMRKAVDYLVADADAIAAFEADQIIIADLVDPLMARRLIDAARNHELFHRLGDDAFDAMLDLLDRQEDAAEDAPGIEASAWQALLTEGPAAGGPPIGLGVLVRSELVERESVEAAERGPDARAETIMAETAGAPEPDRIEDDDEPEERSASAVETAPPAPIEQSEDAFSDGYEAAPTDPPVEAPRPRREGFRRGLVSAIAAAAREGREENREEGAGASAAPAYAPPAVVQEEPAETDDVDESDEAAGQGAELSRRRAAAVAAARDAAGGERLHASLETFLETGFDDGAQPPEFSASYEERRRRAAGFSALDDGVEDDPYDANGMGRVTNPADLDPDALGMAAAEDLLLDRAPEPEPEESEEAARPQGRGGRWVPFFRGRSSPEEEGPRLSEGDDDSDDAELFDPRHADLEADGGVGSAQAADDGFDDEAFEDEPFEGEGYEDDDDRVLADDEIEVEAEGGETTPSFERRDAEDATELDAAEAEAFSGAEDVRVDMAEGVGAGGAVASGDPEASGFQGAGFQGAGFQEPGVEETGFEATSFVEGDLGGADLVDDALGEDRAIGQGELHAAQGSGLDEDLDHDQAIESDDDQVYDHNAGPAAFEPAPEPPLNESATGGEIQPVDAQLAVAVEGAPTDLEAETGQGVVEEPVERSEEPLGDGSPASETDAYALDAFDPSVEDAEPVIAAAALAGAEPDIAADPEQDRYIERPVELVFWNIGAGSSQLFVEVAHKLVLRRLPDTDEYFDTLRRLATGEKTRKSAIESLVASEEATQGGVRWRVCWI